jgi:hypothetical protein
MRAAYALAWANVPIVVVVALLVPFYMFSGELKSSEADAVRVADRGWARR